MSSRALRRAQREKEEQEQARKQQEEDQDGDEGEEVENIGFTQNAKTAFAMLADEADEANEAEESDEPEDEMHEASKENVAEPEMTVAPKAPNKRKKRKKKPKAGSVQDIDQTSSKDGFFDEIDKALKELSLNRSSSGSGKTVEGADPETEEANRLLAVDTNHLRAQNEMRRLFGRAAVEQQDEDQLRAGATGGNRRQQRRVQQVGLAQALRTNRHDGRSGGLTAMALRRNIFIQGKEEWPVATGLGLGMDIEEKRKDGTILYRFVHGSVYQDVQSQFESCVASMDPNRLIVLLQHNPYHISTLLQVSEIAKQESDHATSGDLLERALFSFGRAVHSTFTKNLSEGKARLDFRRAENREFWLASWRYMLNLTMRATWRTIYEWTKLLLSLSPEDDPYALWMVLDQYALRSRQDLDYLNISRHPKFKRVHQNMPNVQLSQGLAEFRAGNQNKGKQAIFTAVGKFPWVIARLLQALNLDSPPAVWGKEPRSDREKLYTEFYATQAKDVWNTPEITSLLIEISSAIPPEMLSAFPDVSYITQSEARHVLLSNNPSLIALIPRHFTTQLTSSSDPIPPDDAFMPYLQRRQANIDRTRGSQITDTEEHFQEFLGILRFLRTLFPDPHFTNGAENATLPGRDGEAVVTLPDGTPTTREEAYRTFDEQGITYQEIRRRVNRLYEIREGIADQTAFQERLEREINLGNLQGTPNESPETAIDLGPPHQARVEDASDEDEEL